MAAKASNSGASGAAAKGAPTISKMEAVRQAMAKLGWEAGRAQILQYVKATLGIDMNIDHISTCRAEILRRRKLKKKDAKVTAKPALPAVSKPASVPAPKIGGSKLEAGIKMQDILAVKGLVERVGASHLKTLIDAFPG
jgi:hypothetical protein